MPYGKGRVLWSSDRGRGRGFANLPARTGKTEDILGSRRRAQNLGGMAPRRDQTPLVAADKTFSTVYLYVAVTLMFHSPKESKV